MRLTEGSMGGPAAIIGPRPVRQTIPGRFACTMRACKEGSLPGDGRKHEIETRLCSDDARARLRPYLRLYLRRARRRCGVLDLQRAAYNGAGRAVYVGGLRYLASGGSLALLALRPRIQARSGGAACASRRLLGLHRLEGPLREGGIFRAAAQARAHEAPVVRLHPAGAAAG